MLRIEDFTPSSEWNDGDRMIAINELSCRIYDYQVRMETDRRVTIDAVERISLISSKSSVFLEANREKILNGNT